MKLWLLRPIHNHEDGDPWTPWYGTSFGFVIRSETEEIARELAANECGYEGAQAWRNSSLSTCQELLLDGDPGIIIQDYYSA